GPVQVGEYFRVRIDTQNVRKFYGADLVVQYDSTALRLVHVDPGRAFVSQESQGGDLVRLSWTQPLREGPSPDGISTVRIRGEREGALRPTLYWMSDTIATLHFKVLKAGTHELSFRNASIYDQEDQGVQFQQVSWS